MDKIVSVNAVRALYFSSQLSQFHVHRFGRHLNTLLHSQRRTFRILNMTDKHPVDPLPTECSADAAGTTKLADADAGGCSFDDDRSKSKETPKAPAELDAIDKIRNFFEAKFHLSGSSEGDQNRDEPGDRVLKSVDLDGLVQHWKAGGFKRIVTMVGAGISTSAGIPDFRSPDTGLYNNLRKYKLPYPTAIFDIDYFKRKPQPFFALAKELYPGQFVPTPCHYFIRLLSDKGLLHRHYTQNIDTLDRIAGIPDERLVEAHGTFHTNHCVKCRREYTQAWMREKIFADQLPKCERCASLVKPDIVFFGENLPDRFYELPERDLGTECDLLIVMGTSLEVHPFAGLVDMVGERCVRLLINRDAVGVGDSRGEGFQFGRKGNRRDVLWEGDCDEGIWWLANELGFKGELEGLIRAEGTVIEKEQPLVREEKDKGPEGSAEAK